MIACPQRALHPYDPVSLSMAPPLSGAIPILSNEPKGRRPDPRPRVVLKDWQMRRYAMGAIWTWILVAVFLWLLGPLYYPIAG